MVYIYGCRTAKNRGKAQALVVCAYAIMLLRESAKKSCREEGTNDGVARDKGRVCCGRSKEKRESRVCVCVCFLTLKSLVLYDGLNKYIRIFFFSYIVHPSMNILLSLQRKFLTYTLGVFRHVSGTKLISRRHSVP